MHRSERDHGFTLVELLVVVGIIALLVAILLPVLQRARDQALRIKCAANLHNVSASLVIYANENKGKLPQHNGNSYWLWDLPYPTRDALLRSGNLRNTLYCAASYAQSMDQNANELWNYSGGYCVTGYFWLMKRPTGNLPALNAPKKYLQTMTVKNASVIEVATDPVLSDNGSFVDVKGGWAGVHSTPHLIRSKPAGGNILFLDGHVAWRDFKEMQVRLDSWGVMQWF